MNKVRFTTCNIRKQWRNFCASSFCFLLILGCSRILELDKLTESQKYVFSEVVSETPIIEKKKMISSR